MRSKKYSNTNEFKGIFKIIAEKTGTSIGTIDHVLHNRAGVKEETRKLVDKVVQKLGYYKSYMIARALYTSKILYEK